MSLTPIHDGDAPDIALAGVDFSQVDFSALYLMSAAALVALQIVAVASIPRRRLSRRVDRAWTTTLLALIALGWAGLVVGFRWPEVVRGKDALNLFLLIGCPVVAPLATLLASVGLRILPRRSPPADE